MNSSYNDYGVNLQDQKIKLKLAFCRQVPGNSHSAVSPHSHAFSHQYSRCFGAPCGHTITVYHMNHIFFSKVDHPLGIKQNKILPYQSSYGVDLLRVSEGTRQHSSCNIPFWLESISQPEQSVMRVNLVLGLKSFNNFP